MDKLPIEFLEAFRGRLKALEAKESEAWKKYRECEDAWDAVLKSHPDYLAMEKSKDEWFHLNSEIAQLKTILKSDNTADTVEQEKTT